MKCLNCGNDLNGKNRKYCNRSCSAIVNNTGVRRHGKKPVISKCRCGKDISNKVHCSHKCRAAAARQSVFDSIENGTFSSVNSTALRLYLIDRDGRKCKNCKLAEWMGKPIPVDVDHIDGNPKNHQPQNIRLLCKNCHALTPTYGNRNKGNGRKSRREFYKTNGYS